LWVDLHNTPEAPPQQKSDWDKVTITGKIVKKKKKKLKMERERERVMGKCRKERELKWVGKKGDGE